MSETMNINQLSDGTLRFAALAALLLLQDEDKQPPIVIIDEPELGLHPAAVKTLCGIIKKLSYSKQIVLATQSTLVVDNFNIDDIIVVDRDENGSHFSRPDKGKLKGWLKEYSLSEIWNKNLMGGR